MRKYWSRRPSAALIVSVVALVAALGGTAYAGFKLPKNSVGTKQLKNNAVTTGKIKNGAVTAGKINPSGLTVPNALHANSANTAGSAGSAGNASTVNGQTVKKFFFTSGSPTTSLAPVATIGPFTLQARCNAGLSDLELTSSINDWGIGGGFTDTGSGDHAIYGYNIAAGTNKDLSAGGRNGGGAVSAATPDGHVITVVYNTDSNPTLGAQQCVEAGTASGS